MSTHHSDGIGEAVDDMLRQAVMIAARLAEIAARARQEHLAQARAESERAGRELTARFEAERAAARSSLAPVGTDSWWAEADPEQIGAAYQTAASWAGQDAEIAQTLLHMDEQLAARGVHVTASMPGRVSDLLRSRAWAAKHDPFMDGAFTREMAQARTPAERDRLNTALVSAWLASPDAQTAAADEEKLEGDAYREAIVAAGHRLDGDKADGRSQNSAGAEQDSPSTDDPVWIAEQEHDRDEKTAHHEWDTAERREQFAASLHGKADRAAVEARVLADISQGTHPRQAVAAAPRNAPTARPNNATARRADLKKGSR
ncbi:hypothetical protein [Sinomonas albida]|uniref:hypothetical protein n=1 Tax=Sinomonas albida TaxID=369942 RepID=UPI003017FE67